MKWRFLFITALAFLLMTGSSFAISFGDLNAGANITINDTIWNSDGSPAINQGGEDNETERDDFGANTIRHQRWDFEGIFWNNSLSQLTFIGGFDFENGVDSQSIGDVFIGDFGIPVRAGYPERGLAFSPELVIDLDRSGDNLFANGGGDVYTSGITTNGVSTVSPASNPYQRVGLDAPGSDIGYTTGEIDDLTGMPFASWGSGADNNDHYFLRITDLGGDVAAAINNGGVVHITMECGNDTMRGRSAVPEPATMLLSGLGLLGMAAFLRRRSVKKA